MEAVPRLYMLSFPLKISPAAPDFLIPLQKYIASHYQEDPESYRKEIKDLSSLRQAARKIHQDVTGCSILKRYFSQLLLLQNRFPMTDDGPACVPFQWTDLYSGSTFTIADIKYEQACILYNIGALHSQLGALDTRSTAEGMKMTCTHFQCAAWAFQHLKDTYPQPKGSDLSHDILTFIINVMLAQAQECILEKSMLDNRKSSITAKVAIQVVDYYKASFAVLASTSPSHYTVSDIVGSKLYKTWHKYIEFKIAYYSSISHYFMGNQCEEQQKMGERVSWFQSAIEQLNDSIKLAEKMGREDLNESLLFLLDVIGGKHNVSKKENDFVYHEKVLPVDNLPEIKGASLVKGISFDPCDVEVSGVDIFSRLVPMEAHNSSSVYSEEKAKLLRSVKAKIEEKDEELSTYMSSLHLDKAMLDEEEEELPQELMEKCAAMSVKPNAISDLYKLIKDLDDTSSKVESDLTSCQSFLTAEEQKEKDHQETFGKRAPSMITMELRKESSKLDEAHKKATDSNKVLKNAADSHIANLTLLSGDVEEIVKKLPSVNNVKIGANEESFNEYQKLLGKVELMQKQRVFLEDELRGALQKDDITKRIVATDSSADMQKLFDDEMKKHEQCLTYIERNLSAQDNILQALTDANASFADVRASLVGVKQERLSMIKNLIASYEAYEDLVDKVKKGLDFYQKLKSNVSRLLDRIKSVTKVQDEERAQRLGAQKPTGVMNHNLHAVAKTTGAPKLKDYLPYMTNTNLPPTTAVVSNAPVPVVPSSYPPPPPPPSTGHLVDRSNKHIPSTPLAPTQQAVPTSVKSNPTSVSYPAPGSDLTKAQAQYAPPYATSAQYHSRIVQPNAQVYVQPKSNYTSGYSQQEHIGVSGSMGTSMTNNFNYSMHGIYTPFSGSNAATSGMPLNSTTGSRINNNNVALTQSNVPNQGMQMNNSYGQGIMSSHIGNPCHGLGGLNQGHPMSNIVAAEYGVPGNNLPRQNQGIPSQNTGVPVTGYGVQATNVPSHGVSNMPSHGYPAGGNNSYYSVGNPQPNQIPATYHPSFNTSSYACSHATVYIENPARYTGYANNAGVTVSQSSAMPISSTTTSINYPTATQYPVDKYSGGQYIPQNYVPSNYGYDPQASYPQFTASSTYPMTPYQNMNSSTMPNPQAYPVYQNPVVPFTSSSLSQESRLSNQVAATQPTTAVRQDSGCLQEEFKSPQEAKVLTPVPAHVSVSNESKELRQSPPALTNGKDKKSEMKGSEIEISPNEIPQVIDPVTAIKQDEKNNLEILHIKELEKQMVLQSKEKEARDPLGDPAVMAKFSAEIEKFEKIVEGLLIRSLNGTIPLDQKWKELSVAEEKDCRKMSISVARCYPMKNRVPDIMPYDSNRVKLTTCKDDYINASYLKDLLPSSPPFIITQAPLPATFSDFWMMVWEQQVENVVCLVPSNELKSHIYWPQERGKMIVCGPLELSLQSQKAGCCFTERIISVTHNKNKTSRVVIHLQFNVWQPSKLPDVDDLLPFISEVLSYYKQQRSLQRPLVVHCSAGVGRSGAFCLIMSLTSEMDRGHGLKDVAQVAARMFQQRKFIINDKDHLQFCYRVILGFAQKMLKKRGILISRPSFEEKSSSIVSISQSSDSIHKSILLNLEPVLPSTQSASTLPQVQNPVETQIDKEENEEAICAESVEVEDNQNLSTEDQPQDSCVTSVLDPAKFTMDSSGLTSGKRRITKDMFSACTGNLSALKPESSDPLSQLDPLWSLKRQ